MINNSNELYSSAGDSGRRDTKDVLSNSYAEFWNVGARTKKTPQAAQFIHDCKRFSKILTPWGSVFRLAVVKLYSKKIVSPYSQPTKQFINGRFAVECKGNS